MHSLLRHEITTSSTTQRCHTMTCQQPPTFSSSISLFFAILLFLLQTRCVSTHQSISFPYPITREVSCRITKHERCPGPCPTRQRRLDSTPDNPSIRVKRGGYMTIHTMRNNHDGGFSRWSLVNLADMQKRDAHNRNAFFYSCADVRVTRCTSKNYRRDCIYDRAGEYFKHIIKIPTTPPNGVYVLGWVWFVHSFLQLPLLFQIYLLPIFQLCRPFSKCHLNLTFPFFFLVSCCR